MRQALVGAQVPLLTVMEAVAPVRVPGRLPLYQVWFDIQPVSFEGAEKLEDLDIQPLTQARRCFMWNTPCPLTCMHISGLSAPPWTAALPCTSLAFGNSVASGRGVHMQEEGKGEPAKMDLGMWMQEDGTGIFGSLLYAMDIFNAATMQGMAKHFVVRTCVGQNGKLPRLIALRHICSRVLNSQARVWVIFGGPRPIFTRSTLA